jgi:hypothetical protein
VASSSITSSIASGTPQVHDRAKTLIRVRAHPGRSPSGLPASLAVEETDKTGFSWVTIVIVCDETPDQGFAGTQ